MQFVSALTRHSCLRLFLKLALLAPVLPTTAAAQIAPRPGDDDPRLQTIVWSGDQTIALTVYPNGTLSVIFHPGERLINAEISDGSQFAISIPSGSDSISLRPLRDDAAARLRVLSDRREYMFDLSTGTGLGAAYIVRFVDAQPERYEPLFTRENIARDRRGPVAGIYRLKGDDALAPSVMNDDGERTYIEWPQNATLPAVLGIGSNGEEEVVDGYMRGSVFTIDRIYGKLVFRIDRDKLVALRRETDADR